MLSSYTVANTSSLQSFDALQRHLMPHHTLQAKQSVIIIFLHGCCCYCHCVSSCTRCAACVGSGFSVICIMIFLFTRCYGSAPLFFWRFVRPARTKEFDHHARLSNQLPATPATPTNNYCCAHSVACLLWLWLIYFAFLLFALLDSCFSAIVNSGVALYGAKRSLKWRKKLNQILCMYRAMLNQVSLEMQLTKINK